jgi:hypothetical protein
LPVDVARRDAAPVAPSSGGSTSSSSSTSSYRSENNFGTSSRVPGATTAKASAASAGPLVDPGSSSVWLNLALLALIVTVGVILGAVGRGGGRGPTG